MNEQQRKKISDTMKLKFKLGLIHGNTKEFLVCPRKYWHFTLHRYEKCINLRPREQKWCSECFDRPRRKRLGKKPKRFYPMKTNKDYIIDITL